MPETKAQSNAAARKRPATRARHEAEAKERVQAAAVAAARKQAAARKGAATRQRHEAEARHHESELHRQERIDRTTELSDDVLKSIEAGQRAAIEAVRRFVDTVDEMLPALGRPSRREQVLDAAMDMADRLVHAQYDFLRQVVQSAGKALSRPGDGK